VSFPIHARYAHPEAGWKTDRATAAEHLTVGEIYTIRRMEVGRSTSYLYFCETPEDAAFNTVQFEPVSDEPPP
jgi:hypothetical protein